MIIKVNSIDDCKICDNFLTLLIQDERKYDTTIDEKFVEEQYRNKGIGTSIIKDVVSKSNSNVYLWVYKDNIKAFNLYNKIGFNIKEETDSRYYMEYKVVENRK